mmetsp:Transcript_16323/g.24062  ORF Transcript_16323/g.24062 Transcript_16323/m.24062 type:complete len:729 (-) Transcript_16323:124-2310(-)|eukprot:CAMPEP_0116021158 /NCGR_PEP_ID=MMETSP0321-20121206/10219_1 /TAXON_ID=163516 /ORGANISM="Leptocylindrus danicus var. danicus, Strain B650" /LENGTH=728 /DNA_ID=CAMNT_0003491973 /DNA_START=53 /DNA_END=2239 /DNA_ORIENTATION=+
MDHNASPSIPSQQMHASSSANGTSVSPMMTVWDPEEEEKLLSYFLSGGGTASGNSSGGGGGSNNGGNNNIHNANNNYKTVHPGSSNTLSSQGSGSGGEKSITPLWMNQQMDVVHSLPSPSDITPPTIPSSSNYGVPLPAAPTLGHYSPNGGVPPGAGGYSPNSDPLTLFNQQQQQLHGISPNSSYMLATNLIQQHPFYQQQQQQQPQHPHQQPQVHQKPMPPPVPSSRNSNLSPSVMANNRTPSVQYYTSGNSAVTNSKSSKKGVSASMNSKGGINSSTNNSAAFPPPNPVTVEQHALHHQTQQQQVSSALKQQTINGQQTFTQSQAHLEWLRQMNSLALRAHYVAAVRGHQAANGNIGIGTSVANNPNDRGTYPIMEEQDENGGGGNDGSKVKSVGSDPGKSKMMLQGAGEDAEKRARRLARNRESARQSRRRKKEQLQVMSEKVVKTYDLFEKERREILNSMESGLSVARASLLRNPFEDGSLALTMKRVIDTLGPNCRPRIAATNFQYNALSRSLLPAHRRFLLWLSLQSPEFFTEAKDERAKTSGRVSSKQVGEEISIASSNNGEKGNDKCAKSKSTKKNVNSVLNNKNQFEVWPLFCWDMQISVEQEERFVNSYQSTRNRYISDRTTLTSTLGLVSNMKRVTESYTDVVGEATNRSLLSCLSPDQTARYLQWMQERKNKERCRSMLRTPKGDNEAVTGIDRNAGVGVATLDDLCKTLNNVLKM